MFLTILNKLTSTTCLTSGLRTTVMANVYPAPRTQELVCSWHPSHSTQIITASFFLRLAHPLRGSAIFFYVFLDLDSKQLTTMSILHLSP